MKRFSLAALSVSFALLVARPAACDRPGFAFLEVPAGARAAALGGAFASLAQDVEASFWNVAGLDRVRRIQVSGTHAEYVQTLRQDQIALAGQVFGGGLAASVRALYSEPIPERDELGNLTGSFGSHDLEFALAYGRAVAAGVSLGASAQIVHERIADEAATAHAFGLGAIWAPARVSGLRLGISAHNLGPAATYTFDGATGAPIGLPAAVQLGGSWEHAVARGALLRTALESRCTRGRGPIGMLGVELATAGAANGSGAAALRGGLRMNDDAATYSLGAGYTLGALRLDYAFVPQRLDLGDTHRVSFTVQL